MPKVVVIDDEPGICELLEKAFTEDGCEVVAVTDSEKAVETVEKEKPDCILLDIKMPKIDGIDVLSRIKGLSRSAPVIMITGYGSLETAMESMKLGAYDYITKPFDLDFVKTLVRHSMEPGRGE
ncbi:MAG: response regulator [Candidatus Omnitrophota bacterium]